MYKIGVGTWYPRSHVQSFNSAAIASNNFSKDKGASVQWTSKYFDLIKQTLTIINRTKGSRNIPPPVYNPTKLCKLSSVN